MKLGTSRLADIGLLVLFAFASSAEAAIIELPTVATITESDSYTVSNSDFNQVIASGSSSVSIETGGDLTRTHLYETSTLNINGGQLSAAQLANDSSIYVSNSSDVGSILAMGNSEVYFDGGSVSWVQLFNDASAELRGGDIGTVAVADTATVHIYGTNFNLSGTSLTGFWEDGTSFDLQLGTLTSGVITDPVYVFNGGFTEPAQPLQVTSPSYPGDAFVVLHVVPLPPAVILFSSALLSMFLSRRKGCAI